MTLTSRVLSSPCVLLALSGTACGDDGATPESGTCPATVPTRLWTSPADQRPQLNGHLQDIFLAGETLLFRWGRDIPVWRLYAADLCGEDVVAIDGGDGLVDRFMLSDSDKVGRIAYGYRRSDRAVVQLDRLAVDGTDAPAEIGSLGDQELEWVAGGSESLYFMSSREPDVMFFPAAGVGGKSFSLWRHTGDANDALVPLAGEYVQIVFAVDGDAPRSAGPVLTLTDAGALRIHDMQGEQVAAVADVRYAQRGPGGTRILWQQLGDDAVESTFVRDLATGEDIALTANAHTGASWGRIDAAQRNVGTWLWVDDDYLGLLGPEGTLVAVHDAATGEALAVPEHTVAMTSSSEGFWLQPPSGADETVAALWNPRDGEVFEWYRQPSVHPFIRLPVIDGDDWYYLLLDQSGYNRGSWWRIDRTTGAWTELLPTLGVPFYELDDGRLVTALENGDSLNARLAVVEPDTRRYTTLAEDVVQNFVYAPEHGVFYLDDQGADMGLWVAPVPEASSRSRSLRAPGLRHGGRKFAAGDPAHRSFADVARR